MSYVVIGPFVTQGVNKWSTENGIDLAPYLEKHLANDWGEIDKDDVQHNTSGLQTGARLMSVWKAGDRTLWIISDAARADGERVVTVLFPEEY